LSSDIGRSNSLPFVHALARVAWCRTKSPERVARTTLEQYLDMLRRIGAVTADFSATSRPDPYNLVVTREWMLMVPRVHEFCRSVSLNSLAFAGALLVRDESQLEQLRELGPMNALVHVAGASAS